MEVDLSEFRVWDLPAGLGAPPAEKVERGGGAPDLMGLSCLPSRRMVGIFLGRKLEHESGFTRTNGGRGRHPGGQGSLLRTNQGVEVEGRVSSSMSH